MTKKSRAYDVQSRQACFMRCCLKGTTHDTQKSREKKPMIIKYSRDFDDVLSDLDCMKLIGLSNNTYYKYKRELMLERAERGI